MMNNPKNCDEIGYSSFQQCSSFIVAAIFTFIVTSHVSWASHHVHVIVAIKSSLNENAPIFLPFFSFFYLRLC